MINNTVSHYLIKLILIHADKIFKYVKYCDEKDKTEQIKWFNFLNVAPAAFHFLGALGPV